ncbi:calcium-binding protein, partial [Tepidamorphus sp. 3E244]|uniref:calcium-binding protein n=1 Tax=Tepidamorphus sp. 3E244 TaxID=3385498 RepID=UPI0038FCEDEC
DAGANVLTGGAGNDTLAGLGGADTLIGGADIDTADYSASASGVSVNLATNVHSGGDAAGDSLSGIENVTGSAFGDVLTGDAQANVLTGSAGADTLDGGDGDDTLDGGADADLLTGGAGADTISGGSGIDTASYAGSAAAVTVNLATNVNTGGDAQGDDISGVENLIGSAGDDTLTGDGADNVISGGAGADVIDGGAGAGDAVDYSASASGVTVNLGTNVNTGGDAQGDDISNVENVFGSANADTITG